MTDTPETKFEQAFGSDLFQKSKVHLNLEQDVIIITEDKLRLSLRDVVDSLDSKRSWIAPISLLATILIVFATTTFQDFIFDAATWRAVFFLCGIGTFLWSCYSIYKAMEITVDIDSVINDVKRKSEELKDETT
jgi:hypothetical protein